MFELFVFGTFWFWALLAAEFCYLVWVVDDEYGLSKSFISTLFVGALLFLGSGKSASQIIHWVKENPMYVVLGLVAYFLIGTAYVITPYVGKWWCFVRNIREINRAEKAKFLSNWEKNVDNYTAGIKTFQSRIDDIDKKINNVANIDRTNLQQEKEKYLLEIKERTAIRDAWANSKGVMTNELLPIWKEYEKEVTVYNVFGKKISITKPAPDRYKSRIISWIAYWPPSLFWTLLNDPIRHVGRMIYESVSGMLKKISDDVWKNEDKIGD